MNAGSKLERDTSCPTTNRAAVISLQINFLIYPQKHTAYFSVTQKQGNISFSGPVCIYGSCQDSLLRGQNSASEGERAELPAPVAEESPSAAGHGHRYARSVPRACARPATTRENKQLFTSPHPPKRLLSLCLRRWLKEWNNIYQISYQLSL